MIDESLIRGNDLARQALIDLHMSGIIPAEMNRRKLLVLESYNLPPDELAGKIRDTQSVIAQLIELDQLGLQLFSERNQRNA